MSHFNAVKLNVSKEELKTAAQQLGISVTPNSVLHYSRSQVYPEMLDLVFGEGTKSFGILGDNLIVPAARNSTLEQVFSRVALNRMAIQPTLSKANVRVHMH